LHAIAAVHSADKFLLDDTPILSQLRAGFSHLAELETGHGEEDARGGRSGRVVFRIVKAPLAPLDGLGVVALPILPKRQGNRSPGSLKHIPAGFGIGEGFFGVARK
jgi:hypothetical protein